MKTFTFNQVVAENLRLARGLRGLTAAEAAECLEPYLGKRWSRVVWSAAERSVKGERIRQFNADDIAAFAATFGLPIGFFFRPIRDVAAFAAPGADESLSPKELLDKSAGLDCGAFIEHFMTREFDDVWES